MSEIDIDGTEYEAYSDVETADLYMAASLSTENWDAASDDTKGKALVTASRLLDRQLWRGTKTGTGSPAQVLAWPRTGTGVTGVEDDVIPEGIINGSIELARYLLDGVDVQNEQNISQKISSMRAGSVALTFFRGAEGVAYRFPLIVQELVGPYLAGSGTSLAVGAIASGVDGESLTNKDYGYGGSL